MYTTKRKKKLHSISFFSMKSCSDTEHTQTKLEGLIVILTWLFRFSCDFFSFTTSLGPFLCLSLLECIFSTASGEHSMIGMIVAVLCFPAACCLPPYPMPPLHTPPPPLPPILNLDSRYLMSYASLQVIYTRPGTKAHVVLCFFATVHR